MGVPQVAETAAYYTDFGLTPEDDGWFATQDGGRQLRIVHAPTRRLVEVRVGVDSPDLDGTTAFFRDGLGFRASDSSASPRWRTCSPPPSRASPRSPCGAGAAGAYPLRRRDGARVTVAAMGARGQPDAGACSAPPTQTRRTARVAVMSASGSPSTSSGSAP
uniref:hypothetical protein n=1 Tax=Streptomyces triticirhizae TaxID=2483353 RepID=UPI0026B10E26